MAAWPLLGLILAVAGLEMKRMEVNAQAEQFWEHLEALPKLVEIRIPRNVTTSITSSASSNVTLSNNITSRDSYSNIIEDTAGEASDADSNNISSNATSNVTLSNNTVGNTTSRDSDDGNIIEDTASEATSQDTGKNKASEVDSNNITSDADSNDISSSDTNTGTSGTSAGTSNTTKSDGTANSTDQAKKKKHRTKKKKKIKGKGKANETKDKGKAKKKKVKGKAMIKKDITCTPGEGQTWDGVQLVIDMDAKYDDCIWSRLVNGSLSRGLCSSGPWVWNVQGQDDRSVVLRSYNNETLSTDGATVGFDGHFDRWFIVNVDDDKYMIRSADFPQVYIGSLPFGITPELPYYGVSTQGTTFALYHASRGDFASKMALTFNAQEACDFKQNGTDLQSAF
mmetsp:Transcript_57385/g.101814  ORF Transcript_57385/g.101814 Transcript_57385/m.101814 type:complete len:397 (-) Transcript_57385:88-1278(-)|eukprot:CAMPEP_0197624308 /NCGR_PEP_ID=MMETSP1338-20131121/3998_1 /TAXON_ID=43686 ORGANISM="Pelagodinium beii, Strain RCC1491" /NCGR_SAMPLE_ID=MMETSP1338 /ASSEMBLY_ACC=CAM_ASM_000754 /LENGTH=396 /DNA_ID=CAMNT_0043194425 /DNA_START=75 /DNA_END=1265 /DNA_ORIENTATION=-